MIFWGIVLIIFGTGMAFSSIKNIMKDNKEGNDENNFDRGFIISGIGFLIIGIWLIAHSFVG